MENRNEKRLTYRRYEDRRVAMLLAVHEIIFDEPVGKKRDSRILKALAENYQVDRVALIEISEHGGCAIGSVAASFGNWQRPDNAIHICGKGFERLIELHRTVEGALSFESVRKPEAFSEGTWRSLWEEGIGASARALLSIEIKSIRLLWLQQAVSTREWSSRDRDLIEEIAHLLARAAQKGI